MKLAKLANRTLFVLSVVVTGSVAGAFVWALLFVMNLGISFVWDNVGGRFGIYFPLAACLVGGLVVGLFAKRFGPYPEDLDAVMAKVKRDGRYDYDKLGVMSIAALLPLFFGGSIGPEAGLTGAVAGICTWVGDRMKRFGADFQQLTSVGTMAALSAIFTAPLFGFAAPLYGDGKDGGEGGDGPKGAATITLPKNSKIVVYFCAIAGALAAFMGLGALFGGGMSLPRFTDIHVGTAELAWLLPLAFVGAAAGWLFCVFDGLKQASAQESSRACAARRCAPCPSCSSTASATSWLCSAPLPLPCDPIWANIPSAACWRAARLRRRRSWRRPPPSAWRARAPCCTSAARWRPRPPRHVGSSWPTCPRAIRPDALMRQQPHHGSKLLASTGDAVSAKNFLTAPRSVVLKYAPQLNS